MTELIWNDELEVNAKHLVIVQRPDDYTIGDELHHLITSLGVSKIQVGEREAFYSLNFGNSYLNLDPHELEQFYMKIRKVDMSFI